MSLIWSPALAGSVGSLLAGLATAIGALPILGIGRSAQRYEGVMLGFAAGVMLAASFFSLIIPALSHMQQSGTGKWASATIVAASVSLDAAMIMGLGRFLPVDDFADLSSGERERNRLWLFVLAITLHNAPEGLAVGVSFANGTLSRQSLRS